MALEKLLTPEPHYIPGYTGYSPQFLYRSGDTYGSLTHKLLIDPTVSHAEKIILSSRIKDDYHMKRPAMREIDLVKEHEEDGDPVYKHPTIPGYEGFIPFLDDKIGHRFSIAATQGIADFERHMQKLRCKERRLKHRSALQDNSNVSRSLGERTLNTTKQDYRLPLAAVYPECEGVIRFFSKDELPPAPPFPYNKDDPPHFHDDDNPEKFIILGYAGHIPCAFDKFGESNKILTKNALCEFTKRYNSNRASEWSPITNFGNGITKPSGPIYGIYHKDIGLLPNYAGHVPGETLRFGKTFGKDTINAKQWLRKN